MSDLEELVPPLNLCKLIPAGEFKYTLFEWHVSEPLYSGAKISCSVHFKSCPLSGIKQYPAPTLQEIMVELPASNIYRIKQTWTANFINDSVDNGIKSKNPATAALKLWLKLKGIEA